MSSEPEILEEFRRISCWERTGQRAPHKPLLLLLSLAQIQNGGGRWLDFADVEGQLRQLLQSFGPPRQSWHPEYPFWRLQRDELWEIPEAPQIRDRENASHDVALSVLRAAGARGGLREDLFRYLKAHPDVTNAVVSELLEATFPPSMHSEILDAIGFPWIIRGAKQRDPRFREIILRAYENRCAICGYDGRLGQRNLGIEAAHIKWHAAGGPDVVENGMLLCSFHHVAFDSGALSLDDQLHVLVSQDVNGRTLVEDLLVRYSGRNLHPPQPGEPAPARNYLEWHRQQVFRGPARIVGQDVMRER